MLKFNDLHFWRVFFSFYSHHLLSRIVPNESLVKASAREPGIFLMNYSKAQSLKSIMVG